MLSPMRFSTTMTTSTVSIRIAPINMVTLSVQYEPDDEGHHPRGSSSYRWQLRGPAWVRSCGSYGKGDGGAEEQEHG